MEYRQIGKTGCQASVIGLGCEHLDGKPYEQVNETITAALDNGINIMDVFMPGKEVRENIAKALGKKRKDVMIQGHIGSTDVNQQYDICRKMPVVKRYFEDLLRIFGGYIDFGMMFFIDSEEDYKNVFNTDFADYVLKLKEKGDIGHIGFSSHNPITAMRAIETGLPDMLMFSANMAFDMYPAKRNVLDDLGTSLNVETLRGIDPDRLDLYRLCEKKGIGMTVMKSLGAGKLISPEHTPFIKPMTVQQCIYYALTRPAAASVMLGCQTAAQVQDAMTYFETSQEERDYSRLLGELRNDFKGNCVYCSHCQPCPSEIDIATVNKYLDIANLDPDNIPPSIHSHYNALENNGSDCVECGACENRCPFGVPVIANMNEAIRMLEIK